MAAFKPGGYDDADRVGQNVPPGEDASQKQRAGKCLAELVQPAALRVQEVAGLRRIFSSSAYGSPGPQSILNTSLRDNEAAFSSLVEALDQAGWSRIMVHKSGRPNVTAP